MKRLPPTGIFNVDVRQSSFLTETLLYEFNPAGKIKWLQKLCFWILGKCKARQKVEQKVDEWFRFSEKDIQRYIDEIEMRIMSRDIDLDKGGYLFLGRDEMKKLRQSENYHFEFCFSIGMEMLPGGQKYHGFTIVMIPWMEGILMVPQSCLHSSL